MFGSQGPQPRRCPARPGPAPHAEPGGARSSGRGPERGSAPDTRWAGAGAPQTGTAAGPQPFPRAISIGEMSSLHKAGLLLYPDYDVAVDCVEGADDL